MTDRLHSLAFADLGLLLAAWIRFAWVDVAIRTRPFAQWRDWLDRPFDRSARTRSALPATRIIALSEWVARHHWAPMNCLRRCIVQRGLLARHGIDAQLHLGVRAGIEGEIEAHAWLSHDGHLLNDSPDVVATYRVLQADAWDELPRIN